jgi:branched-chain amino acid transport system ATP-binding protein
MLEIQNLDAGYKEFKVLKDVSMSVAPNEIVAIIGPNGAGKSTVIKSIFSITNQTAGKIIFKGEDITKMKTHELLQMGVSYVPQGKINFTNMSVEENLIIGVQRETKNVVAAGLTHVYKTFPDLKKYKKSLAYGLSGGQQQMLALGRALMQKPSLLLLDEPSLGLSPKLQKELFAIIKGLKSEGMSIMMVEQNAKKAIDIADKTYLLENGKVVLEGGRDIVKHKEIRRVYLGGE